MICAALLALTLLAPLDDWVIRGRLLDPSGEVVEGMQVRLVSAAGKQSTTRTDALGNYVLRAKDLSGGRLTTVEVDFDEETTFQFSLGAYLASPFAYLGRQEIQVEDRVIGPPGAITVRILDAATGNLQTEGELVLGTLPSISSSEQPSYLVQQQMLPLDAATGETRLERLAPGKIDLQFRQGGYELARTTVEIEPGVEQVVTLEGNFTRLTLGFDVGPFPTLAPPRLLTLIDAAGKLHSPERRFFRGEFEFRGLTPGAYRIAGLPAYFAPLERTFVGNEGQVVVSLEPVGGVELVLRPPTEGAPAWSSIEGAPVRLPSVSVRLRQRDEWGAPRLLRRAGPFDQPDVLRLPEGEWLFEVELLGYPTRRQRVQVGRSVEPLELQVFDPTPIHFVLDPAPVHFALDPAPPLSEVRVRREGHLIFQPCSTDEDGKLVLSLGREVYEIEVRHSPFVTSQHLLDLTQRVPESVTLAAPPTGFLHGRVVLPEGRTVAEVGLQAALGDELEWVQLDEDGTFRAGPFPCEAVTFGVGYRGRAGFWATLVETVAVSTEEVRVVTFDLAANPPGTLDLTVVDGGEPASTIVLVLTHPQGAVFERAVDEHGRTRLEDVPPGCYTVTVTDTDAGLEWAASRKISVESGATSEQEFELGRVAREVILRDADGKALSDFSFCVGWGDPPRNSRIRATDDKGRWTPGLPPGPVTIWPLGSRPDFGYVLEWGAGEDPVVVTMGGR